MDLPTNSAKKRSNEQTGYRAAHHDGSAFWGLLTYIHEQPLHSAGWPAIGLIKSHDLDPIRSFAGRIASDRLQGAALGLDRVHREHVRFLASGDDEPAAGVDVETARLLLRRRACEVDQLSVRAINAQRPDRARRTLGGIEEATVRAEMKIGRPDVVIGVAQDLARASRADRAPRH